jgi:hypothetical protein
MSAAKGNQYAAKERSWAAAINRALDRRNLSLKGKRDALDALAEQLLTKCDEGEMQALKELGDRLDGKPAQSIAANVSGDITVKWPLPKTKLDK